YGCIVYQEQVMQIVRDLGGYTLGRSDLVRRAMSKKKQAVMEQERRNFVYGNPAENVPGCTARGIDEKVASGIYDTMMDFAKYAFNKSHAACYAVVAYQTAWLKYYYPMEFMAALMTSVIDHPTKVASYILACRSMKIRLLPPDINEGEAGFSVSPDGIRYALTAIKGVGRPVIDAIITERRLRGPYKDLRDFLTRMASQEKDVNRRTVENFIKSGALDCLGGTRKQLMSVFVRILEDLQSSKKNDMAGQMTLFDIADEEDKKDYEIRMPDVGEYPDELRLAFEKEVLGIYVSGHPLQAWEGLWKSRVTATAADFVLDEDAAAPQALLDRREAVIGGIISEKTIKYTKNGEVMAFLSIEDLTGTVEVIVFPRTYEENADALEEDNKIFIRGRISLEEEKDGKLIASKITPFEDVPRRVWLRFPNFTEWKKHEKDILRTVAENGGPDQVVIYIEDRRIRKVLPPGQGIRAGETALALLRGTCGDSNVVLQ
ncbi:MAG: OB-fold nucleic acid binding domain-containing protein, partial [Eubacteriales bacterium]|nr:OB-fold nucleic acid binding domain-containing protein [Eubacteriales bacterium]